MLHTGSNCVNKLPPEGVFVNSAWRCRYSGPCKLPYKVVLYSALCRYCPCCGRPVHNSSPFALHQHRPELMNCKFFVNGMSSDLFVGKTNSLLFLGSAMQSLVSKCITAFRYISNSPNPKLERNEDLLPSASSSLGTPLERECQETSQARPCGLACWMPVILGAADWLPRELSLLPSETPLEPPHYLAVLERAPRARAADGLRNTKVGSGGRAVGDSQNGGGREYTRLAIYYSQCSVLMQT